MESSLTKHDQRLFTLLKNLEDSPQNYQPAVEPFSMGLAMIALDIVQKSIGDEANKQQAFGDVLNLLTLGFALGYCLKLE